MKRKSAWLSALVGVLLLFLAAWGPLLMMLGESTPAEITEVRRLGGADEYARYFWSVSYRFRDASGEWHRGQTRVLAGAINPLQGKPRRVRYLPFAPWANALSFQASPGVTTLLLAALGLLLLWPMRPRARNRAAAAATRARPGQGTTLRASGHDDMARWLDRYPGRYRRYALVFFGLLLVGVGALLWWELEAFNAQWLASMGGFALLTGILMIWSARRRNRAWTGTVSDKRIERHRVHRGESEVQWRETPILEVQRSDRSRPLKIPVPAALFDYFECGDRVFKLAGFDWPEKIEADPSRRVCIVCGRLVPHQGAQTCPWCRAPVAPHSMLLERITQPQEDAG
ncbi:MAG: hypothetical protein ACLFRH_01490 [Halothiobacillaceae bacterium]